MRCDNIKLKKKLVNTKYLKTRMIINHYIIKKKEFLNCFK